MEVYALQVWFGIIIAVSGLSLHRTGPAFYRNKFGFPVAIIGIITTILIPENVPEPDGEVMFFNINPFSRLSNITFVLFSVAIIEIKFK